MLSDEQEKLFLFKLDSGVEETGGVLGSDIGSDFKPGDLKL